MALPGNAAAAAAGSVGPAMGRVAALAEGRCAMSVSHERGELRLDQAEAAGSNPVSPTAGP